MLRLTTTRAMYHNSETWSRVSKPLAGFWVLLFVIASYQNVANAATLHNTNAHTEVRTASNIPNKNTRKIMDPAFANAGRAAGLEIWRIENFKPVPYPKSDYGKFYSGDSYIVLFTKEKKGEFSWDIHFWLGSQTSQDEAGAAAIFTVQLDDQLGGTPIQYREVQEHESQLFLSRFKSGVRYLPGGVSSGFAHVDRDQFEKNLYQVKGKRNIRVRQVPLSVASMNKGDCFILDAGNDIYVYVGAKSKRTERLKAVTAANLIRDQDHGGRSKVHVIDEFSTETEIQSFFTALGGASPADVPDESAGGDDEQFETSEERKVILYRISDSTGKMQIQEVGQKPLKQNQLDTNDCFILDTAGSNIFVWTGKQCNKKEKDESITKAQGFITAKHYPSWTNVVRVVESGEPSIFTQYFQSWQGKGDLHPRLVRSAAARPTPLAEKSGGEVPEFMPDDGTGDMEIFRVENFELVPVPVENYGKFFGGDSYVIKYRSKNGKWIVYYWQGAMSTRDETAAAAIHAIQIDNELGGKAVQIRVVQNFEPKHFLHLFKGKLIIFLGGHVSGFNNIKEHETYVKGATRLFCVRGTNENDVRATEQVAKASKLASDDVFVVENDEHAWLWFGKDSDEVEKQFARNAIASLAPEATPVIINEGEEPNEFWDALGGKMTYCSSFKCNLFGVTESKLYHCHVDAQDKVKYEEIEDFEQKDLDEDDVMVLDSTEEVYVWVGKEATEQEIKQVHKKLPTLLEQNHRNDAVVITVKQGEEPETFTSLFSYWNSDYEGSTSSYEALKQKLRAEN